MIHWMQPKEYLAYGLEVSQEGTRLVLIGRSYHEPTIHHIARRHAYKVRNGRKPLWLPVSRAFIDGRRVLAKVILA